jgi:protein-S-isoprenylcysteine O-methyltransferase Ste14
MAYIVFTGPIFTSNIVVLSFEVFALFLIAWTLWTIKFDKFSLLKQSTKKSRLVPKGPFVYIRHPIYTALIILSTSWVYSQINIPRVLVWIILMVTVILTIIYYEHILSKQVSDFGLYKQRTYRIIPFIY